MTNPPGHMSGFHIPGTLVPIGAVMAQHQQALHAEQAAETKRKRRRKQKLLLFRR